jgi:hypothetical protein
MEIRKRGARWAAFAVLAASLAAGGALAQTGDESAGSGAHRMPGAGVQVPVAVSIKTDKKTYAANDPIKMTIIAKNPSKQTVNLPFATGQKYDIEIRRGKEPNGERVWQWSRGKMFTMIVTSQAVAPGKALTYKQTYDPAKEKPLMPGTYTVRAVLTTSGRAPRPYGVTTLTVK